jgi:hypothetical protein
MIAAKRVLTLISCVFEALVLDARSRYHTAAMTRHAAAMVRVDKDAARIAEKAEL